MTWTLWVDLLRFVQRSEIRPGGTEGDLQTFKKDKDVFKSKASRVVADHQPSKMSTLKFHLFDHLIEDLQSVRCIEYLHAWVYDAIHQSFESPYCGTSRICSSALQEMIIQEDSSIYKKRKTKKYNTGKWKKRNSFKLRSAEQDRTHLLRSGVMTTLMVFETIRKSFCQKDDSVDMNHYAFPSSHLHLGANALGEDVPEVLQSGLY